MACADSDARKEKKRKEIAGRLGKEMIDRRDEYVLYNPWEPTTNLYPTALR